MKISNLVEGFIVTSSMWQTTNQDWKGLRQVMWPIVRPQSYISNG